MRIAFIGLRGIPAAYGGFETLVEHLAPAFVEKGHEVTVYCRRRFNPEGLKEFRGVRLVTRPALSTKYFETLTHTLFCLPHLILGNYDAIIMVNAINALYLLPLRMTRSKTALNVDGVERKRKKWNLLGQTAYALSELLASTLPHVTISDAVTMQRYYMKTYGRPTRLLTYGGDLPRPESREILDELGLKPGKYFLYVARFEPENHPEAPLLAHRRYGGSLPLVMLGDNPYDRAYVKELKAMADDNVLFPGALYGAPYRQLLFNAAAEILAFEVGGTHPALVEAMGAARPILLNDTPENREVAGETAAYFTFEDPERLSALMDRVERETGWAETLGASARKRMEERYTWERVIRGYEELLHEMVE